MVAATAEGYQLASWVASVIAAGALGLAAVVLRTRRQDARTEGRFESLR